MKRRLAFCGDALPRFSKEQLEACMSVIDNCPVTAYSSDRWRPSRSDKQNKRCPGWWLFPNHSPVTARFQVPHAKITERRQSSACLIGSPHNRHDASPDGFRQIRPSIDHGSQFRDYLAEFAAKCSARCCANV